jgi:hypothetical protein
MAALVLAGVGFVLAVLPRNRETQITTAVAPPRAEPPPAAVTPQPKPAAAEDAPWARVERTRPAEPAATPARPGPDPGRAEVTPAREKPVPAREPRGADYSGLRVQAIDYSPVAAARAVTLTLDGARPFTLHEGQSARGVEVQLILPEVVYVHIGTDVFAVKPE